MTFNQEFVRAVQRRMIHDAQTHSTRFLEVTRTALRDEILALQKGEIDDAALSPFQKGIRAATDELSEQWDLVLDALRRNSTDEATDAAAVLLGGIAGKVLALEARIGILEDR